MYNRKREPAGLLEKKRSKLIHLRWMCRAEIVLTAIFSVWANVLHVKEVTGPSLLFAAAPPVIVILAFEAVSRIPMLPNSPWYRRLIRPIVTGGLAFGGAWLSYWHQKDAILRYNAGDQVNASVLPLLIDGFMIIASVSVIELNYQIDILDAKIQGVELAQVKVDMAPPREKTPTQRQRIATAMTEMPWANPQEIATKLGDVKLTYVQNVMSELRKAQANGNGVKVAVNN